MGLKDPSPDEEISPFTSWPSEVPGMKVSFTIFSILSVLGASESIARGKAMRLGDH